MAKTHIRHQKETAQFENFAYKTTNRLKQEYFSKIYSINLTTLLIEDAQEMVDEKIKNGKIKTKHNLKVNQNIAFGIVKDNLVRFLLGEKDETWIDYLISEIAKYEARS